MKRLFDEIVREVSYRTNTGIVDFKNREHISILSEVLDEFGCTDIKHEWIQNLYENQEDEKYTHLAYGYYVKKGDEDKEDAKKFRKEDDKYVPVSDSEYEERAKDQGDMGGSTGNPNAQTKDGTPAKDSDIIPPPAAGEEEGEVEPELGTALSPKTKGGKDYQEYLDNLANTGQNRTKKDEEETPETLIQKDHELTDSQLNMTKEEAKKQAKQTVTKNVGLGTPESRAGEAMIHKGLRLLQSGKSFEDIESQFKELVGNEDHVLNTSSGKKWVESAISSLRKINEVIGVDNIESVSWDTPQGKKAMGINPNIETASDMFIKTKDGNVTGVSLKKDGNVFISNGGWATQSKQLLDSLKNQMPEGSHQLLSEAMSIDAYNKDISDRFVKTTETITADMLKKSFKKLQNNEKDQKEFQGSNRDAYFSILSNPDLLIEKIKLGTASNNEQKAYSKLLQTYHTDEYDYLRKVDDGLTQRTFDVLSQYQDAKRGMNRHIIKSMHITETLSLNETLKEGGIDKFMTLYGIKPDGAVLNESTLITLFGSKFKQTLEEVISEVRKGNLNVDSLEDLIVDSIEIDYESGQILFKHESNKKFPLFKMTGRTRGIGSAPIMELYQTKFMAYALTKGTFNVDEWDTESIERFQKDIIDDPDEDTSE